MSSDDIVTQLHQHANWLSSTRTGQLCADAADEIERLQAESVNIDSLTAEFALEQAEVRRLRRRITHTSTALSELENEVERLRSRLKNGNRE